jgi:hypothetical protein
MGSGDISVHRQALLNQAAFWDAQAATTGGYGRQATGAMWHGEAGIFASVVDPYTAARNYQTTEDTNAGLSSAAIRG